MATVTYTIPDDKLEEFKVGFLKACPVPIGENEDTGETAPIMSENAWIKEAGKQFFIKQYRKGKEMLAKQAAVYESDLIS